MRSNQLDIKEGEDMAMNPVADIRQVANEQQDLTPIGNHVTRRVNYALSVVPPSLPKAGQTRLQPGKA